MNFESDRGPAGRVHGAQGVAPDRLISAMNTTFRVNTTLDHNNCDQSIDRAVVAAQAGDMEAIRFLYLRYKDNVYGYVLSIVREQHEAEDCTQQVFMKLISAIHKYEPRTVPFTAWILRVARNIAIDHLRQRRAVPREEVFEPTRQTDESSRECRWGLEVGARGASRGAARRRRAPASRRPDARRDRHPHGPHRVIDPRPAPPRPAHAAAGARQHGLRSRGKGRLAPRRHGDAAR